MSKSTGLGRKTGLLLKERLVWPLNDVYMVYNGVLQVVMETGSSKNWFSTNKPTCIQPILTFQHVLLLFARSCDVQYMGKRQLHACHGERNYILHFTLQIFRGAVGCHSFEIDIFV